MESVFRLTPGWAMHKNHDHMPPNLWPFVIICIWFKTCIDWYWMCDKFREKMWEAPIQNWPQQARMCYSWVTGTQEHLGSLWSGCQGQEKALCILFLFLLPSFWICLIHIPDNLDRNRKSPIHTNSKSVVSSDMIKIWACLQVLPDPHPDQTEDYIFFLIFLGVLGS